MSFDFDKFLEYLDRKYPNIKTIQQERILLEDGTRPRWSTVLKDINGYLDVMGVESKDRIDIINHFKEYFKPKALELAPDLQPLLDLIPAVNISDIKDCFLVEKGTYQRSPIDIDVYTMTLNLKMAEVIRSATIVTPVYNPREKEKTYPVTISGIQCLALNSYTRPQWFNTEAKPQIPTLFKGLIDHLIVTEEAKVYFYDWLYKSLTDRAYTFLVLCGQKGIGKGQLQKLIRALHGAENFVEGKRGTIGGQFNSQLQDSRLVWFDEIHYDKPDVNNMKRMLNDMVSIERKGIDATKSTHIHCSIVLSNNELADNYIELDDRRFSPLELTEINLTKVFDADWFDEFNYHTDDLADKSPLVAEFGKWILEYGKCEKIGKQEPYKGEKFNQIVLSSLRLWQDNTVNMLLDEKATEQLVGDKSYFTYNDLRRKNEIKHKDAGIFPKKNKVLDFLRTYLDPETGEKLVEIYRVGREDRIVPIHLVDNYLNGFKEVKGYERNNSNDFKEGEMP